MMRAIGGVLAGMVLAFAGVGPVLAQAEVPEYVIEQFGTPPAIPSGAVADDVMLALQTSVIDATNQSIWQPNEMEAFEAIVASGDPRLAWLMTDMMRFSWKPEFDDAVAETAVALLGIELETPRRWAEITNHLLAWDIPAYPGYLDHKKAIFTNYLPGLEPIIVEGNIAWQTVSWGGVPIDPRPYDTTDDFCNCIPAVDNPEVSSAEEATWLADDAIVFGIVINGKARAYPRRIMEIREMVNDTLGGRDLGIPYCTLCGSAQAYFTDGLPEGIERPVLRTSGLLIRSNKVMYDVVSYSVFDTFTGEAVTGPLAERGLVLEQAAVITTDWATWRQAHPDTTVLLEEHALGRDFDLRNTRDANGPIFPVGDVDPRLSVHEDVVGIITGSGTPVAFQRSRALAALNDGAEVAFEDVRLVLEAGGLRAVATDGSDLGSHQAFWFAWSQFHPDTALWGE